MIRRISAWGIAVALIAAGSVGAQEAKDQSKATPKSDEKGMKVTGCLQAGTTASTFTLTNAIRSQQTTAGKPSEPPREPQQPAPEPAMPEAVGTAGQAKTYELTAEAGVDLSAHVGHRVEVTAKPAAAAGARTEAETKATPRLTVTALRHISPTCTQ